MEKKMMKSNGVDSRSSAMKRRRLLSAAAVLLICCLAFVGAVGANEGATYWDDKGEWIWANGGVGIVIPDEPKALVSPFTAADWALMKQEDPTLGPYPDLTIALNFTTEKLSDSTMANAQLEYYGEWIADFLITVNKTITFEVTGNNGFWGQYLEEDSLVSGQGYFGGFYNIVDNWIVGPSSPIPIQADTPMPVVATGLGRVVPYNMVFSSVGTFLCGINLTNEYLSSNGPVEVTLGLWMLNPADVGSDVDLSGDIADVTSALFPLMRPVGEEHTYIVDTVDGKPSYVQKWDIIYEDKLGGTLEYCEGESNPSSYTSSSSSFTLKNPRKDGYDFAGWEDKTGKSLGFDVLISEGTTGDKKYVATWTIKEHTVTFETNGGSPITPSEVEHNKKVSEPPKPTKEGYRFENWYSDSEFEDIYDFDTPVTNPLILYANWTAESYTVTVASTEGGTAEASENTAKYGDEITLTATPDEGYSFFGWITESNIELSSDGKFTMPASDVTVKAVFKENSAEGDVAPPSSGGGGGDGGALSFPRFTENGGLVDFGSSKVVKAVLLPEGSRGSVLLKVDTVEKWPKALETEYPFDISVEKLGEGVSYIHFEIPVSTLDRLAITPADIGVYHLVDEVWVKLAVTYEVKDGMVCYEAETDSFSPFKLVIEEGAAVPKEEETVPVIPPTETPDVPDEPEILPPIDEPTKPTEPTEPETPAPILAVLAGLGAAVIVRRK